MKLSTLSLSLLQSLNFKESIAHPQTIGSSVTGKRNYCQDNPCQNEGICHMDSIGRSYQCECVNGFNGAKCEIPAPKLVCGTREITVSIDKRMIAKNNLDDKADLISFGESDDEECKAYLDVESGSYKLSIKSPFSKNCGTSSSRSEGDTGDYIFSNDIFWRKVYQGNSGEAPIQRKIKLVDFNCHYEDEYMLQMVPIKPAEITIEEKISKGTFEVDMTLWKNSNFERDITGQYSANPIVRVGQEVCVKLNLRSDMAMSNLVLTASDCWAAGSDNPMSEDEKHYIITKKCKSEKDYTTTIKQNGISSDVKFCFKVYKWDTMMDNLFVQCKVSVCDDSIQVSGSSQCVCPPKSFEQNSWFYPNYYGSQLDQASFDYGDSYDYGYDYQNIYDDSYGNAADIFANDYSSFEDLDSTYGNLPTDYISNYNYESNYGSNDYLDQNWYYDYAAPSIRKRRSIDESANKEDDQPDEKIEDERTDEGIEELKKLHNELPQRTAKSDPFNKAAQGLRPTKKKRLDIKDLIKKYINKETGDLELPKGLTKDPKEDLMEVGYGPILIKEAVDPETARIQQEKSAEVHVTRIEDTGEWFETEAGAQNVVLMAVGGSLIFAIIVLGVVIGIYVQFRNQADIKAKNNLAEQQKVKEFYQGVIKTNKDGRGSGNSNGLHNPQFVASIE